MQRMPLLLYSQENDWGSGKVMLSFRLRESFYFLLCWFSEKKCNTLISIHFQILQARTKYITIFRHWWNRKKILQVLYRCYTLWLETVSLKQFLLIMWKWNIWKFIPQRSVKLEYLQTYLGGIVKNEKDILRGENRLSTFDVRDLTWYFAIFLNPFHHRDDIKLVQRE